MNTVSLTGGLSLFFVPVHVCSEHNTPALTLAAVSEKRSTVIEAVILNACANGDRPLWVGWSAYSRHRRLAVAT